METLIMEHGGKIASGVSKQLNYLIVGENRSSKLDKARNWERLKLSVKRNFWICCNENLKALYPEKELYAPFLLL